AIRIRQAVALTGLYFGIHHHEIANHAHLVRVRPRMRGHEPVDDLGLPWVGNVQDCRSVRPMLMPHIGESPLNYDLSATGNLHSAEMANAFRAMGPSTGVPMHRRQNLRHDRSPTLRLP